MFLIYIDPIFSALNADIPVVLVPVRAPRHVVLTARVDGQPVARAAAAALYLQVLEAARAGEPRREAYCAQVRRRIPAPRRRFRHLAPLRKGRYESFLDVSGLIIFIRNFL